jgi:predicted negative regulator of RcsB-dependent stress response
MATQLNLEEQEQIDQIKHFWHRWGNLITWFLILVLAAYSGWNGWQWWERRNASQAAVLYDAVDQAVRQADMTLLDRSLNDIQSRYASAAITQHASLLAARVYESKGATDKAQAALRAVVAQASDEGLVALASLRLAALQMQAQDWAAAKATLERKVPATLQALFDEAMGDWSALQGQNESAQAAYLKAWKAHAAGSDGRRWLEIKLAPMGVQPQEKS